MNEPVKYKENIYFANRKILSIEDKIQNKLTNVIACFGIFFIHAVVLMNIFNLYASIITGTSLIGFTLFMLYQTVCIDYLFHDKDIQKKIIKDNQQKINEMETKISRLAIVKDSILEYQK